MGAVLAAIVSVMLVAAPQGPVAIDDLAWLSGRWESVTDEQWVEEYWSEPRGGTMFGFSRTGTGGALREFEYMRLQQLEDGGLAFIALPSGQTGAAFRLIRADATSVTFENAANDFPQRIQYRREGETLRATISALDGSNAIHWIFRRRP